MFVLLLFFLVCFFKQMLVEIILHIVYFNELSLATEQAQQRQRYMECILETMRDVLTAELKLSLRSEDNLISIVY